MSFIVIDGPNGAGKTTIVNRLKEKGIDTLSSPNGTPLAKFLRPVCRGTDQWEDANNIVKFLCFSAARLDEYIRRVHNKSHLTIADRWWTSTYIYQVLLEGINLNFLEYTIHPEEKIDKVIILTGTPEVLIDRVNKEREKNPQHGKCSWTKEKDMMIKIINLYNLELPKYLTRKKIPWELIDTTNYRIDQVETKVLISTVNIS